MSAAPTMAIAVTPPVSPVSEEDVLRSAFVEMLFALAVSQIAVFAADLLSANGTIVQKIPSLIHLFVGLVVIAASWVGWRQSASPGMKDKIKDLFSLPFVGLLLDVVLVILYFIIVRSVEIDQKGGITTLTTPSAVPEALGVFMVFAVYVIWDLIADVFSAGCIPRGKLHVRAWKALRVIIVSVFASASCALLTYVVYRVALHSSRPMATLFLDAGLICVILFFRVEKAIENVLAPLLQVSDCKAFETPRRIRGNEGWVGFVLILFYGICLIGAAADQRDQLPLQWNVALSPPSVATPAPPAPNPIPTPSTP